MRRKLSLANYQSIIPLLVPVTAYFLLFNSGSYLSYIHFSIKIVVYVIVGVSTILLPLTTIPFLIYTSKSWTKNESRKLIKIIPLIVTTSYFFFSLYLLNLLSLPSQIQNIMLVFAIVSLATIAARYFSEICITTIALGTLSAVLIQLSLILSVNFEIAIMTVFLIAGIISYYFLSRNTLKPIHIYLGFILGFCLAFSSYYFI